MVRVFRFRGGVILTNTIVGIICALPAVVIAITIHEYAHARAADALGDPTPRQTGRLTLDPLAHIDWLGIVCLVICGFGWGRPVEIRSGNFRKPRRDIVLATMAGPLSNLACALVFGLLFVIVEKFEIQLGGAYLVMARLLESFITWNTLLFAFNLIPVPPLDGYKVLRGLSRNPMSRFFTFMDKYGIFVLLALVLTGATRWIISALSVLVSFPIQTISQLIL